MTIKTFFIALGTILIATGIWYVVFSQKIVTQEDGVVSHTGTMTPLSSSLLTPPQETPSPYTDWKIFTSLSSHLSFKAPLQAEVVAGYGSEDVHVRIGSAYYQTLGITGTTSIMLDVGAGRDIASTATAQTLCNTTSSDARTGSASSTLVMVGGQPFYDVQTSDVGMNQYIQDDRYVQMSADGSCRFIDIRTDTANPGVYSVHPAEIQAIQDNNARVHIETLKQYIFDSIVVQ